MGTRLSVSQVTSGKYKTKSKSNLSQNWPKSLRRVKEFEYNVDKCLFLLEFILKIEAGHFLKPNSAVQVKKDPKFE